MLQISSKIKNQILLFKIRLRFENIKFIFHILNSKYNSLLQFISPSNDYIYVLGDSHAYSFTHPKFKIYCLGPVTAFNLNNNNSSTKGKLKLLKTLKKIPKNNLVILVFGEIDCRLHIYNNYLKNNKKITLNKLIQNTIDNYEKVLKKVQNTHKNLAVFNVVPAGEQPNIYNYPFYGTREQRQNIAKKFNSKLKKICKKNHIIFIDIFNQLSTPKGNRLEYLKLDRIHYSAKISNIIFNFLNKPSNFH